MRQLYLKELKLNVKWPVYLMGLMGAVMLVPNYPLIVGIGYTIFQIFIYLQFARENRSQEFSAMLPVKRNDIVTSTTWITVTLQMMTTLIAAVCAAAVRILAKFTLDYSDGNQVGLDANLTFFGVGLVCLAVFNLIFIPKFFKTGYKYGAPILLGLLGFCGAYVVLELVIQLVPALRNALDTYAVKTVWARILVLVVGAVCYAVVTFLANRIAQKKFEKVSL